MYHIELFRGECCQNRAGRKGEEEHELRPKSSHAEEFIHHGEIEETLAYGEANSTNRELIDEILAKARERRGLTHREAMGASGLRTGGQEPGNL